MTREPAANAADLDLLQKLNRDYIKAVQDSDVLRFEDILSADFVNSNPDGSLVDRHGFLAQIAAPAKISNLEASDVRIRVFGDIAIVHGRTTYRKADGQAAAGRYTDVWSRQQDTWRCVAAHVTRG